ICQIVCPHNQTPKLLPIPEEFSETLFDPYPSLESELTLTAETFKKKFKSTAVLRTKWQGYLRNVVLALGNQKENNATSSLKDLANSEVDQVIQEACSWSLSNFPQNN
ncbi:MAG: hypothetical protein MUO40_00985, partial [Anaerolineaceae bacterium]|nr:hypothetical protein [Anaerolineaceae bacterium]